MGFADSFAKFLPKVAEELGIGAKGARALAGDIPAASRVAGQKTASILDTTASVLIKPFSRTPGFVRKHPIAATATAAGAFGIYHATHRSEAADQAPVISAAMQQMHSRPDALVDLGAPTIAAANENLPGSQLQAGTAEAQGSLAASQGKVASR